MIYMYTMHICKWLLQGQREWLLRDEPKMRKLYSALLRQDAKRSPEALAQAQFERRFLARLLDRALLVLDGIDCQCAFLSSLLFLLFTMHSCVSCTYIHVYHRICLPNPVLV